jgi:tetratricopeptide (TPR) repeat protein
MTMMTEHRRTVWLLALILTIPTLASAVREGRLLGRVVDPDGNPIAGVTVTATSPDIAEFREVMITNKKGMFKVDFHKIFVVYKYRFEKIGYITTEADQDWKYQGTMRHEFTMYPGETPDPDAPPPPSTSAPAILAFNDGVAAYEASDYETARTKFEEALGFDPALRLAWELLSVVQLGLEDYAAAAESAEKALELGSTEESVLRARWEAYRNLGDEAKTAEAQADLDRIGRLAEEAKRIYNEGVALSKAGDAEGAFATFQDALEADPNLRVALVALATTALKIDRHEEAAAAAEAILDEDPQNEQALRIRYNAALKLRNEGRVIDSLVGLAAVDPETARDGLFLLANLAFESDDTVKAKERLDKVLEVDPDHPRSHYLMGLILMREAANEEAQNHLERFLQLAPDDPDRATAEGALKYLKES